MNPIKDYINKELYGQTEEEFQQSVKLPDIEDDFLAKLEWSLLFLSGKYSDMRHSEGRNSIRSLKAFDGAWLLNMGMLGGQKKDDMKFFSPFGDLQVSPEIFPDLNITFLQIGETAQMNKLRTLSFSERRGLMSKQKYVTEHKFAYYDVTKEKWFGMQEGYTFNGVTRVTTDLVRKEIPEYKDMDQNTLDALLKEKGLPYLNLIRPLPCSLKDGFGLHPEYIKLWKDFFYHITTESEKHKVESIKDDFITALMFINMAYQAALTGYYEWFVYIRETPNSVGFKIPVLPEASKEVFSLRDIPEGSSRKKAIVNFVREHQRTKSISVVNEEERKILVRKHFRGENKFNWRGLEVNIIPSQYDLTKIKTSKKFMKI